MVGTTSAYVEGAVYRSQHPLRGAKCYALQIVTVAYCLIAAWDVLESEMKRYHPCIQQTA